MSRFSPCVRLAFATLAAALVPSTAAAQWPIAADSGGVAVCIGTANQAKPRLVSDGSGGAIVVWSDRRALVQDDIFAQRVSALGIPQWVPNGVPVCTLPGNQNLPFVVSDGSGGAILCWTDGRDASADIYAQRLDPAGRPMWTDNGVPICHATGDQDLPGAISDGVGGAILYWVDARGSSLDIYAQRIDGSGSVMWVANGVPVCTAAGTQDSPAAAPDGTGGVILTWVDGRIGSLSTNIFAQRITAGGSKFWTHDGVALCVAQNQQFSPTIASDGVGGAIVAWSDRRPADASVDIYAQRVNAGGQVLWPANGTPLCNALRDQFYPVVSPDGGGGVIACWVDHRDFSNGRIYSQRVDAGGAPSWSVNGILVSTGAFPQWEPTVVSDGEGGALLTWGTYDSDTVTAVKAQRLSSWGYPRWAIDGASLSNAPREIFPTILSDGLGGAIVTWARAAPSGGYDVRAQRVRPDGGLGVGGLLSVVQSPSPRGSILSISPNPSHREMFVSFSIDRPGSARLDLLDITGRIVATRHAAQPGYQEIKFTGIERLSPGIYLLRLTQSEHSETRKVSVVQ